MTDEYVCECGNNTFFFEREETQHFMKCTACQKQKEITYWIDEDGNVDLVVIGG